MERQIIYLDVNRTSDNKYTITCDALDIIDLQQTLMKIYKTREIANIHNFKKSGKETREGRNKKPCRLLNVELFRDTFNIINDPKISLTNQPLTQPIINPSITFIQQPTLRSPQIQQPTPKSPPQIQQLKPQLLPNQPIKFMPRPNLTTKTIMITPSLNKTLPLSEPEVTYENIIFKNKDNSFILSFEDYLKNKEYYNFDTKTKVSYEEFEYPLEEFAQLRVSKKI
jgi:hypothetical protein